MNFDELCHRLQAAVARDPGRRGAACLLVPGDLAAGARVLRGAGPVLIATGFPMPAGVAETDGPPGALALARTLLALGQGVTLVAEAGVVPALQAGLATLGLAAPVVAYPLQPAPGFAAALLNQVKPGALVSIERPGRSPEGRYHNMRGEDISARVAPVDDLFVLARQLGMPTVAVGDGGNELGMGKVRDQAANGVPLGPRVGAATACDWLVAAGVSNWGAWALAAAVAALAGRADLLPAAATEAAVLAAMVRAGAVDGVTGHRRPTVDGLPAAEHRRVLAAIRAACA